MSTDIDTATREEERKFLESYANLENAPNLREASFRMSVIWQRGKDGQWRQYRSGTEPAIS